MKKILVVLLVGLVSSIAMAQKGKPDIPGALLIDFGFNYLSGTPSSMDLKLSGSYSLNFYYQYDIKFGQSKFSFHPGIGIGTDRYSFDRPLAIVKEKEKSGDKYVTSMDSLKNILPNASEFKNSKLLTTYLDIPLEFRFYTHPYDIPRSFKVGIGTRIGVKLSAHNKIKYSEGGSTIKWKKYQDFDLNTIRYGATVRIGIRWFSLFYYYSLSDLFKSEKGPEGTSTASQTFGLTISGF